MRSRKIHPVLGQSLGVVFYVDLLTKRKNECKQRQKEQTKGHNVLKIKMIFYRHHPHSVKMRGQPTLQHGCYFVLYHSFPISTILFFMRLSDYPSLFTANFVIALNSVNANRLVRYTFNNRHIMKSFRKLSLMRFPIIRRSPGLQGFYQSLSLYCN